MKRGKTAIGSIGERLRLARQDAGYTSAADAARAYGFNIHTYGSAENNNRAPGRLAAARYAKAFRVSLDWLLEGRGPKSLETISHGGFGASAHVVRAPPSFGVALQRVPSLESGDLGELPPLSAHPTDGEIRQFLAKVPGATMMAEGDAAIQGTLRFVIPKDHFDSMVDSSPRSLFPNDVVFVAVGRTAQPDDMVLASDGRRGIVRMLGQTKIVAGKARVSLLPRNIEYAEMVVDRAKIIGPVVSIEREVPLGSGRPPG
jgi:hypothetical protein